LLGAVAGFAFLFWLIVRPGFLGAYATTAHVPRFPPGLLDSMGDHLTHVMVGVGIAPVLLFFLAVIRGGSAPTSREQHVFAWVGGLAALLLIYQSGFYSRQIAGGSLQERYLFYVVALFAVATAVVLSDIPRRLPIGALLGITAVLIPIAGSAMFAGGWTDVRALESAASGLNDDIIRIHDSLVRSWTVGGMVAACVGLVAVLVALALYDHRWRRYTAPALGAAVLVFCLVETQTLFGRVVPQVNAKIPTLLGSPPKSWVDGLLFKGNDKAGVIEGQIAGDLRNQLWLWTEFWNTRIERVYTSPGVPSASALASTTLVADPQTGRIQTGHEEPTLVVAPDDPTLRVRGDEIRTIVTGQRLIRPVRPYQADLTFGPGGNPAVPPAPTPLALFPRAAGATAARVTLELTAASPQPEQPVPTAAKWVVSAGGRTQRGRLQPSETAKVTVTAPVDPQRRRAVVLISAPPSQGAAALTLTAADVRWTSS
jgi:hypothetical protein